MKSLTVIPAYGRDYTTAKAARADWDANVDWIIADHFNQWDGKPINKSQADAAGYAVTLRFYRLTRTCRAEADNSCSAVSSKATG